MKANKITLLLTLFCATFLFVRCDDDDNGNVITNHSCDDGIQNGEETGVDCGGPSCAPCGETIDFSGKYVQQDQAGRPLVNTIFGSDGYRDQFNLTVPTDMEGEFRQQFEDKLLSKLNPDYTTNVLNQNAEQYTKMLATDVLWLAQMGPTTFYGPTVLTGRSLGEDVADTMLLFTYGGPNGNENPEMTKDNVNGNDATFQTNFPYLAAPFSE